MKKINGGVTAAKGFFAAGVEAQIKYKNRKDMALVYTKTPAVAAGTFTTNLVKAAPVKWDQQIVADGAPVHAVVLNSGIANACTGAEGMQVNEAMAQAMGEALGVQAKEVLTCSTGVIGMQLPVEKFCAGAKLLAAQLSDTEEAGTLAAEAIMTTDTVSKQCAVQLEIGGKTVTIGGMSKGSGMIHPNMATMLCVITTDAAITREALQKCVSADVVTSFNQISVDRDTSTNDTLLMLANGQAGNEMLTEDGADYAAFCEALHVVTTTLAKKMAADGEGATRLLTAHIVHANSEEEARILSKAVITSNLVKTAVYGSDANWGRILCALGYSGVSFDPEQVDLWIESVAGKLQLVGDGMAVDYSEEFATQILSEKEVVVTADMKQGEAEATAWGCDLTYEYVKINGDYRS